ncbi:MAG: threonine ammonia-lyase, biosynthetic [Planctomycetia bacterium]|nr:threonine ammonia-lyase, biosynthetic [Planctomycetia bacterium]
MSVPERYLRRILTAQIYDVAKETPLEIAEILSARLHNRIFLKREDLQSVFSFKLRGAYNKMANLTQEEMKNGVVAASAGNHAQGVALAARKLGIKAYIFMPDTTPGIKVNAVRAYGATVKLVGDSYDDAYQAAVGYCEDKGAAFIHPYDDPDVIAGQGTIGFEILKQHKSLPDMIFVPVGGGGLIAGIAVYVKMLCPNIKIIGVEPEDADAMKQSLQAGRRVRLKEVGLFADGVAVKQVGKETFKLTREFVDEVITVSTDELCAGIKDIFEDTRSITEPAGALAVAGIKKYVAEHNLTGLDLVAVTSGANMNFDRLRHVAERAEIGEHREGIIAVTIPEKPGSFRAFCAVLGRRGITEFNYRYSNEDKAHVFVGLQIQGPEELVDLLHKLRSKGYETIDMSENEMAKMHMRHLVGGHAGHASNERLFRFRFPERPGALLGFLSKMGKTWNISLFHYRNHGADFGRVLVGMQVPPAEKKAFQSFLKDLGYSYVEETDNPAYKLFLG